MVPGGVCANLDYEIDQMVDYVAEMSQRLILPQSSVSLAFQKYVQSLLTSTRLPSTTILLGLNYLARRVNLLKDMGTFKPTEAQAWRMMTIGLLLGSKFLDDNTFQNRSWSEVSGMNVADINRMEIDWLQDIEWNLYVNLDESHDFQAWMENWRSWREGRNKERSAVLERLAPLAPLASIDPNIQRPRPYQAFEAYQKPVARERPQSVYTPQYEQGPWQNPYPTPQLTPPSAPDSGLNTPEYMSATGGAPRFNDWSLFNQYPRPYVPQQNFAPGPGPRIAAYNAPFHHYGHHYPMNFWDPSPVSPCNCCPPQLKQPYYGMSYAGMQTVVG